MLYEYYILISFFLNSYLDINIQKCKDVDRDVKRELRTVDVFNKPLLFLFQTNLILT